MDDRKGYSKCIKIQMMTNIKDIIEGWIESYGQKKEKKL